MHIEVLADTAVRFELNEVSGDILVLFGEVKAELSLIWNHDIKLDCFKVDHLQVDVVAIIKLKTISTEG